MDAVRPQWLKLAFQWQDPNLGCFPDAPPGFDDEKNFKFWVKFKRYVDCRILDKFQNNKISNQFEILSLSGL